MEMLAEGSAVLNKVLRSTYKEPGKTEAWILRDPTYDMQSNPSSNDKLEWDHFFEVQHFISILFSKYDGPAILGQVAGAPNYWKDRPLGQYETLSRFINDVRNLYAVDRAFNQRKKDIQFESYFATNPSFGLERDSVIDLYLECVCHKGAWLKKNQKWENYKMLEAVSVQQNLASLLFDMVNYQGEYPELAKEVGERLAWWMGWLDRSGWRKLD